MEVKKLNSLSREEIDEIIKKLKIKVEDGELYVPLNSTFVDQVVEGKKCVFVALECGEIVGWADVSIFRGVIELMNIENFSSIKGVGTLLLDAIKNEFEEIKTLALEEATGFYLRNGFKLLESREDGDLLTWSR